MQLWSSVKPSPPQTPLSSELSPPLRESTTWSPSCSNIGSPRPQRRRTRCTVRWGAPSSSAPGWTQSCSVRTCSRTPMRSTGKAARHHLSQPESVKEQNLGPTTKYKSAAWRRNFKAMIPILHQTLGKPHMLIKLLKAPPHFGNYHFS